MGTRVKQTVSPRTARHPRKGGYPKSLSINNLFVYVSKGVLMFCFMRENVLYLLST